MTARLCGPIAHFGFFSRHPQQYILINQVLVCCNLSYWYFFSNVYSFNSAERNKLLDLASYSLNPFMQGSASCVFNYVETNLNEYLLK